MRLRWLLDRSLDAAGSKRGQSKHTVASIWIDLPCGAEKRGTSTAFLPAAGTAKSRQTSDFALIHMKLVVLMVGII